MRSRSRSWMPVFAACLGIVAAGSSVWIPAGHCQNAGLPPVRPGEPLPNGGVVQGPAAPITFRLEGVWAGVGYLDEAKLAGKLEAMTAGPERDELVNKAATFLTIVAALDFRRDGGLETDLEVTAADGKAHNEPTVGRWKLVERKENRFLIELQETLEDKTERTSRRLVQFYEDGEHIALLMETDPLLAEFNPLIVLERVPEAKIASAAAPSAPSAAPTADRR